MNLYPGNPHLLLSSLSYGDFWNRENENSYAIQNRWLSTGGVAKHMRVMLHNVKGSRRRRGFTTKADSIWSFQGTNTIGYETAV